jgi:glycosyltransferase involved in cell wall biosynthesis
MSKKFKIMYIIPAEGFGGAERQALLHIKNLPSFDIRVVAVTGPGKKVFQKLDRIESSVYYCSSMPGEYAKPFSVFSFTIHLFNTVVSWIKTLFFLIKLNSKENVDLIFGSRVAGWTLASPLAAIFKIPCVWRFGSRVHGTARRFLTRILCIAFKPTTITSNCQAVAQSFKNLIKAPVIINPNGIDCEEYNPNNVHTSTRDHLKIDQSTYLIGLAVRPSPDKGMTFLADVIECLKKSSCNAHFCVAGEFGWREKIQNQFKNRNLNDYISFLGHVDDIGAFYAGCDVIALTSMERSIEGFPNSLLEAMAMGRPVIATAIGGVPELIEHRKTGILVDRLDPELFSSELVSLLNCQNTRTTIGNNARQTVIERYSIDMTVGTLASVLRSVGSLRKRKHNNSGCLQSNKLLWQKCIEDV